MPAFDAWSRVGRSPRSPPRRAGVPSPFPPLVRFAPQGARVPVRCYALLGRGRGALVWPASPLKGLASLVRLCGLAAAAALVRCGALVLTPQSPHTTRGAFVASVSSPEAVREASSLEKGCRPSDSLQRASRTHSLSSFVQRMRETPPTCAASAHGDGVNYLRQTLNGRKPPEL